MNLRLWILTFALLASPMVLAADGPADGVEPQVCDQGGCYTPGTIPRIYIPSRKFDPGPDCSPAEAGCHCDQGGCHFPIGPVVKKAAPPPKTMTISRACTPDENGCFCDQGGCFKNEEVPVPGSTQPQTTSQSCTPDEAGCSCDQGGCFKFIRVKR